MAFEFDTKTLFAGLGAAEISATNAAVRGMHDATDDLLFRSREESSVGVRNVAGNVRQERRGYANEDYRRGVLLRN